ncbi:hypothetical protein [Paenibacillus sp. NPDC057934]|uniref:hypothetical protein n=1 Tax=Paenibacillus sp. NPDC057934 TaxID=3346282 RepID=UPI0036D8F61E
MKNWKRGLTLVLSLIMVLSFFVFQKTATAASVGTTLPQPEEGWVRIDDTNPGFVWSQGWKVSNQPHLYKGSMHYTTKVGETVTFKFYGSSLRIIDIINSNRSQKTITIDGVVEQYSGLGSPNVDIALVYEKLDLPLGNHTVTIKSLNAGYTQIDAIDIVGELLDPGYVEPEPTPSPDPTATASPEPTIEPTPIVSPSPTPEQPSGDRAILVVTMNTGLEKEFDLPMSEVAAFLSWYDSASGSARYGINKHDNNKGPFSKRTDYVIFDKILTFEVSEYTAK